MSKLDDFGGDEQLAAEYSNSKTCSKSDSGYHCSCYDLGGTFGKECCICERKNENFYRGPVRKPTDFSKHLVLRSIKK